MNIYTYTHNSPIFYTDPSVHFVGLSGLLPAIDTLITVTGMIVHNILSGTSNTTNVEAASKENTSYEYSKTVFAPVYYANLSVAVMEADKAKVQAYGGPFSSSKSGNPKANIVPNPYGKNGGPLHKNTIDNIQKTSVKGKMITEYRYKTPDGIKSYRYADKVEKVGNNVIGIYQVGKVSKNGLPVSREAKAIEDIMSAPNYNGAPIYFIPYNSNIGPITYLK